MNPGYQQVAIDKAHEQLERLKLLQLPQRQHAFVEALIAQRLGATLLGLPEPTQRDHVITF